MIRFYCFTVINASLKKHQRCAHLTLEKYMNVQRTMIILMLGSALGFALGGVHAATTDSTGRGEKVLAASKRASGGAAWDRIDTLVVEAILKAPGGEGSFGNDVDLRAGRTRMRFEFGPMTGALGWDGKQAWTSDPASGMAVIEKSQEETARRRTVAYVGAYGFYFPSRMPAVTRYVRAIKEGGASFDVISVTPAGGVPIELWINSKTHLIDRQVSPSITPPQTFYLTDYREVDGIKLPYTARATVTATGQDMHTSHVSAIRVNVLLNDTDFSGPPAIATKTKDTQQVP